MAETSIQEHRRRFKVFSWSGAALVVGILIAVNFIASYIPIRLDTSRGQAYSISRGSKEILKKLDDTMLITVVFTKNLPSPYKLNEQYIVDLLAEYKRASNGKIRVEYIDPAATPQGREEAQHQYGITPVQLDVRERDRREVKECFMGVSFRYGDKREAIPLVQDTDNLEYEITLRIKKLLSPTKPAIGFVKNGEAATQTSESILGVITALRELYNIADVDLNQPVPPFRALWLVAPTQPLTGTELSNLAAYLNNGGTVGLLIDRYSIKVSEFRATAQPLGLDSFLAEWGISIRPSFVLDPQSDRIQIQAVQGPYRMINIVDYPYFPWVTDLDRFHPATKGLDGVSMPFVSPIQITEQKPGFTYTPLVTSTKLSFLDTQPSFMNPLENKAPTPESPKGPFILGLLVEGPFKSPMASTATAAVVTGQVPAVNKNARFIVFGTSRFIDSAYPPKPSNYSLFVNLVDWSVQDDVLIQIRSKGYERRPLKDLSDGMRLFAKYFMGFALPLVSIVIGLFVWQRQKNRRALLPLTYAEK